MPRLTREEINTVSLDRFDSMMKEKYGFYFPLARKMFQEYGPALSFSCTSAMFYAMKAGKGKICLRKLKNYLNDVLSLCHPGLRASSVFRELPVYRKTQAFLGSLMVEFQGEIAT